MNYFLALVALVGVFVLVRSFDGEIRDFDITQYEKAKVAGIVGSSKDKINIQTPTGVNVTVFLPSIGSISLKFQDEKNEREIYHTHFIQSAEAKLGGKDLLLVKIAGAYMSRLHEEEKEEKIFVFNLSGRKLIGWAKVK